MVNKTRFNPALGKRIKIRVPSRYGSWDEVQVGEISHEEHIKLQRDLSMNIWEVYEDDLKKRYPNLKF